MILQILDLLRTWTLTYRKKKSNVAEIDPESLKRLSLQMSKRIQWSIVPKVIHQVSSLIKLVCQEAGIVAKHELWSPESWFQFLADLF